MYPIRQVGAPVRAAVPCGPAGRTGQSAAVLGRDGRTQDRAHAGGLERMLCDVAQGALTAVDEDAGAGARAGTGVTPCGKRTGGPGPHLYRSPPTVSITEGPRSPSHPDSTRSEAITGGQECEKAPRRHTRQRRLATMSRAGEDTLKRRERILNRDGDRLGAITSLLGDGPTEGAFRQPRSRSGLHGRLTVSPYRFTACSGGAPRIAAGSASPPQGFPARRRQS